MVCVCAYTHTYIYTPCTIHGYVHMNTLFPKMSLNIWELNSVEEKQDFLKNFWLNRNNNWTEISYFLYVWKQLFTVTGEKPLFSTMFTSLLRCDQAVDKKFSHFPSTRCKSKRNKKNMVQIWQDKEAIFSFSSFRWLEDKLYSIPIIFMA